jgi:hypothetical protein
MGSSFEAQQYDVNRTDHTEERAEAAGRRENAKLPALDMV